MKSIAWQLEDNAAQLDCGAMRAVVDLTRPSHGCGSLWIASRELTGASLLAVSLTGAIPTTEAIPTDRYIRGTDLVASYRPTSSEVQVDVLWRAVRPAAEDAATAIVELVVSARTEQLEGRPEVMVQSSLPCEELLRPLAPDGRFTALDSGAGPVMLRSDDGPGRWLFRLPGSELSYAEMVHPVVFCEDRLERPTPAASRAVRLTHRLFPEPLERGVIVRARVRGVFLPRESDVQRAAAVFASFAATEPPLGT